MPVGCVSAQIYQDRSQWSENAGMHHLDVNNRERIAIVADLGNSLPIFIMNIGNMLILLDPQATN